MSDDADSEQPSDSSPKFPNPIPAETRDFLYCYGLPFKVRLSSGKPGDFRMVKVGKAKLWTGDSFPRALALSRFRHYFYSWPHLFVEPLAERYKRPSFVEYKNALSSECASDFFSCVKNLREDGFPELVFVVPKVDIFEFEECFRERLGYQVHHHWFSRLTAVAKKINYPTKCRPRRFNVQGITPTEFVLMTETDYQQLLIESASYPRLKEFVGTWAPRRKNAGDKMFKFPFSDVIYAGQDVPDVNLMTLRWGTDPSRAPFTKSALQEFWSPPRDLLDSMKEACAQSKICISAALMRQVKRAGKKVHSLLSEMGAEMTKLSSDLDQYRHRYNLVHRLHTQDWPDSLSESTDVNPGFNRSFFEVAAEHCKKNQIGIELEYLEEWDCMSQGTFREMIAGRFDEGDESGD